MRESDFGVVKEDFAFTSSLVEEGRVEGILK
jgi:hypothetical protein